MKKNINLNNEKSNLDRDIRKNMEKLVQKLKKRRDKYNESLDYTAKQDQQSCGEFENAYRFTFGIHMRLLELNHIIRLFEDAIPKDNAPAGDED